MPAPEVVMISWGAAVAPLSREANLVFVEFMGTSVRLTGPSRVTAEVTSRLTRAPLVTGAAVERIGPTPARSKVT